MYKMKDEYKIGIDFIDEQHARLFEIADEAYNLLKDNFTIDKYDNVVEIIDELKDYTRFHFSAEEKYMESINYKRMFTQKIEHENFIKKLEEVDYRSIDENPEQYVFKILEFLNEWLTGHILHNDKLIGK
ncbi:MAG: hemerythrin family protein [Clostridium sp.]|nr:hemerythrin family protein [Clostridium sp.]